MATDHAPSCPFCQAPWTDAMLAEFERFSTPGGCQCCHGEHGAETAGEVAVQPPVPVRDLCCEACGRAIYRKP